MDNSPEGQETNMSFSPAPERLERPYQSKQPDAPNPAVSPQAESSAQPEQAIQDQPGPMAQNLSEQAGQPAQTEQQIQPQKIPLSSQKVDYFKDVATDKPLVEEQLSDFRRDPENQVELDQKSRKVFIIIGIVLAVLVILLILWFTFWAPEEIRISIGGGSTSTPQEAEEVQNKVDEILSQDDQTVAGTEAAEYYETAIENAKDDNERFDMQIGYAQLLADIGDSHGSIDELDSIDEDGLTDYQKATLYLQYYAVYLGMDDEERAEPYYYKFYALEGTTGDEEFDEGELQDIEAIEQELGL